MSKSTPISNLPNVKAQAAPAFEQRDNEIVKEILSEIDRSNGGNNQGSQQQQQQVQMQQAQQQQAQQQQAQMQAQVEQQMLEQQMMEQQMMEQQQQQASTLQLPSVANDLDKPKSLLENVLANLKLPLLVGVIVMLLSIPFVQTNIVKGLSSKEALKKFAVPIAILVKGVLGAGLYYAGSTMIPL